MRISLPEKVILTEAAPMTDGRDEYHFILRVEMSTKIEIIKVRSDI